MARKNLQTHLVLQTNLCTSSLYHKRATDEPIYVRMALQPLTETTSPSNLQFVKATLGKTEELEHGHHKDGQIWQRAGLCDILRHFVTRLLLEIKIKSFSMEAEMAREQILTNS